MPDKPPLSMLVTAESSSVEDITRADLDAVFDVLLEGGLHVTSVQISSSREHSELAPIYTIAIKVA